MKFDHRFTLFHADNNTRIYKCDDVNMRIDFIRDMFKVSLIRNEDLLPTFSINPDRRDLSLQGRDKLSLDGFELCAPEITVTVSETHIFFILFNFRCT